MKYYYFKLMNYLMATYESDLYAALWFLPYPIKHLIMLLVSIKKCSYSFIVFDIVGVLVAIAENVFVAVFFIKLIITIKNYIQNRRWTKEVKA